MKRVETLTAEERRIAERQGGARRIAERQGGALWPKALRIVDQQAAALAAAHSLVAELTQHLDYIGWGDPYEREHVCAKGGLKDRAEAFLAEHTEVSK